MHEIAPRAALPRGALFYFINRKQSALFYSINRKKSARFKHCSRVLGEFDGEDGHVVGRFVVCDPSEGGGENILRERLRVERAQGA